MKSNGGDPRRASRGAASGFDAAILRDPIFPSGLHHTAAHVRPVVGWIGRDRRLSVPGRRRGASGERQDDEKRREPSVQALGSGLDLFRALLGMAGAMLGANSIVILVRAAGPSRQGRAMGIFAAAQAVGVSMGPVVGGVLLAALGWRWVFWVSVPFALAGAVIGWMVLPQTTDLGSDRRFDWQGAILLMPALTALLLTITESHAWGPTSPAIIASTAAAAVLLSMFIRRERRAPEPLIDLDLFRITPFASGTLITPFASGTLAIVLSYAMLYGIFFLMSFALVRGYHASPLAAGLRLAIIPVALGIVAPFSGALHERLGKRTVLLSGMGVCTAALILLSVVLTGTADSLPRVMVALAVFGAGLGMFIAPNNSATMSAAPRDRSGEAGGCSISCGCLAPASVSPELPQCCHGGSRY